MKINKDLIESAQVDKNTTIQLMTYPVGRRLIKASKKSELGMRVRRTGQDQENDSSLYVYLAAQSVGVHYE